MRIGVTGAGGLVGTTLVALWRQAGHDVVAWSRREMDVTRAQDVTAVVADAHPDVVIHLAAYTDVDRAESEPDLALAVNGAGTGAVAAACRAAGARCVYVSSDYVLNGEREGPLPTDAPVRPVGAYARSKAAGEQALRAAGGDWMIARTGWVFGPGGRNFVDTMRERAAAGKPSRVVQDQHGAPTSTRFIASVLLVLVTAGSSGTWHIAPAGATTWFDVARLVYTAADADTALVSPCDSAELGRPAPRPRFAVLETGATERALGRPLPPWQRDVESYVRTGSLPRSAWERENA